MTHLIFKVRIANTDATNKKFSLDFTPDSSVVKKAGFEKKLYEATNEFEFIGISIS